MGGSLSAKFKEKIQGKRSFWIEECLRKLHYKKVDLMLILWPCICKKHKIPPSPSSRKEGIFFRGVRFLPGFCGPLLSTKNVMNFFTCLILLLGWIVIFQLELPSIEGDFSIDKESYFKNSFKTFHQRVALHTAATIYSSIVAKLSLSREALWNPRFDIQLCNFMDA